LNFGLYCFLVVIDLSSVNDSAENLSLLPGLKSGDHYNSASSDNWMSAYSNATSSGSQVGESGKNSLPSTCRVGLGQ